MLLLARFALEHRAWESVAGSNVAEGEGAVGRVSKKRALDSPDVVKVRFDQFQVRGVTGGHVDELAASLAFSELCLAQDATRTTSSRMSSSQRLSDIPSVDRIKMSFSYGRSHVSGSESEELERTRSRFTCTESVIDWASRSGIDWDSGPSWKG